MENTSGVHSNPKLVGRNGMINSRRKWFLIEKKDGTKIGAITHFPRGGPLEIGFATIPDERSKGYRTEAVKIIVD